MEAETDNWLIYGEEEVSVFCTVLRPIAPKLRPQRPGQNGGRRGSADDVDFVVRHVACTSGNGTDTDGRLIAVPREDDEGGRGCCRLLGLEQ